MRRMRSLLNARVVGLLYGPDIIPSVPARTGREDDAGRGDWIRTSDSCVPNAVLYQAELHPERRCFKEERARREASTKLSNRARPRRSPILADIVCNLNLAEGRARPAPSSLLRS